MVYDENVIKGNHTFNMPRLIFVQTPPQKDLPLKAMENERIQAIRGPLYREGI